MISSRHDGTTTFLPRSDTGNRHKGTEKREGTSNPPDQSSSEVSPPAPRSWCSTSTSTTNSDDAHRLDELAAMPPGEADGDANLDGNAPRSTPSADDDHLHGGDRDDDAMLRAIAGLSASPWLASHPEEDDAA